MRIAYVRCSSATQNEARQKEALQKYDIERWYSEKVSGKDIEGRPELKAMLDFAREGDVIYVEDFSRLAGSVTLVSGHLQNALSPILVTPSGMTILLFQSSGVFPHTTLTPLMFQYSLQPDGLDSASQYTVTFVQLKN